MLQELLTSEEFTIPKAFQESVYLAHELQEELQLTESEFWGLYRSHRIPSAVFLPTTPEVAVWDKKLIRDWLDAGCPVAEVTATHEFNIFTRLKKTFAKENPAAANVLFNKGEN